MTKRSNRWVILTSPLEHSENCYLCLICSPFPAPAPCVLANSQSSFQRHHTWPPSILATSLTPRSALVASLWNPTAPTACLQHGISSFSCLCWQLSCTQFEDRDQFSCSLVYAQHVAYDICLMCLEIGFWINNEVVEVGWQLKLSKTEKQGWVQR